MWSLGRYVIYFVAVITVNNAANLQDFDLPGIFSRNICDNDVLKERLLPLCNCREKFEINDIHSLCSSHVEFGNCVQSEIHKDRYASPYMTHVFSNRRLKQVMAHLCRKQSDAYGIATCTKPDVPMQCNTAFTDGIQNMHNISEKTACTIAEQTGDLCYWRVYEKECPPIVKYFWSTLAESFVSTRCSKYLSKSKGDKCSEIKNAFHPNVQTQSRGECHKAVHTMRQCFELETLSSLHHDDIWLNMEFELDRYIRFERFRCDIKKEKDRNHHCEYPHRKRLEHCFNDYNGAFKKQAATLQHGGNVTVQEICSVYGSATHCIGDVLKDCPVNAVHFKALFCGAMPTSCNCPVNLEAEVMARSSRSNRLLTTTWILIFCLSVLLLYQ